MSPTRDKRTISEGRETKDAKRRPRRGLSLDRLISVSRPPLPHAATVEVPPRPRRRTDRPPLRRSIRLEDDDGPAEERRRVFVHGHRPPSFDEGDVTDDEADPECECQQSSLERSADADDADEPELASPPIFVPAKRPHLRGVSSDRMISDRRDLAYSPANRAPSRALSHGIFERKLPKIYKGLMDKSKRASSSALYERNDPSPTEAFYNSTGSTRLSSQELFEKFCSEDFTSLYGRNENRCRRTPHSKSTGSSGSDVRLERPCCKRVMPCGSQPVLATRRQMYRAAISDKSTDSEENPSPGRRSNYLGRQTTFVYENDDDEEREDLSRSAPLLSPNKFEARFTFDISEHSEVPSGYDETPSDATETRNLTLYEEPHSDRTSICELFDAAFSSNRQSFRKPSLWKQNDCAFDLTHLDFRAIDDESPVVSRRPSQRSTEETLRQNSESHSWASDSVFNTPERRFRENTTSPSSVETRKCITAQSGADTTLAEELPSVIEREDYVLAMKLGCIELEVKEDEQATSTSAPIADAPSRASMHKLEPLSQRCKRGRRGASEPRRRPARCVPL